MVDPTATTLSDATERRRGPHRAELELRPRGQRDQGNRDSAEDRQVLDRGVRNEPEHVRPGDDAGHEVARQLRQPDALEERSDEKGCQQEITEREHRARAARDPRRADRARGVHETAEGHDEDDEHHGAGSSARGSSGGAGPSTGVGSASGGAAAGFCERRRIP